MQSVEILGVGILSAKAQNASLLEWLVASGMDGDRKMLTVGDTCNRSKPGRLRVFSWMLSW